MLSLTEAVGTPTPNNMLEVKNFIPALASSIAMQLSTMCSKTHETSLRKSLHSGTSMDFDTMLASDLKTA